MHPYLSWAEDRLEAICEFIRDLVEVESPTDSADAVNRVTDVLVQRTGDLASACAFSQAGYGRHVLLDFNFQAGPDTPGILALGHLDTVWPVGTLAKMPFRKVDGRIWGPGVLDMKAGIAQFIFAMRMLRELSVPVSRRVSLLIVSDEEVGSPSSRQITEAEAANSNAVLVLEPGTGLTGKLKTARKGIANYRIKIAGKAAHAGVDFEQGASAILEAAHVVRRCAQLTDLNRGITVNPGVLRGGTRSNVIAAEAEIQVDVRASVRDDLLRLDGAIRSLETSDKRCSIEIEGGINRPPMERTAAIAKLFEMAKTAGSELGLTLEESSTGGGSDGNFTAALGIPTLDGLGAVGEGAHAAHESVLIGKIAERTALVAKLVSALAG